MSESVTIPILRQIHRVKRGTAVKDATETVTEPADTQGAATKPADTQETVTTPADTHEAVTQHKRPADTLETVTKRIVLHKGTPDEREFVFESIADSQETLTGEF